VGVAAGLLVFAGLWRALEWAMSTDARGAARLVPLGLAYLVAGALIVLGVGMPLVAWAAVAVTLGGLGTTFLMHHDWEGSPWILRIFMWMDLAIIAALGYALFF